MLRIKFVKDGQRIYHVWDTDPYIEQVNSINK